jgi:hypothetical protein
MDSSTLALTSALAGGWVVTLPPGKTRYVLYRRLGGPQSRSGRVRKISPPPGFDTQTVQPVATELSRSTLYNTYRVLPVGIAAGGGVALITHRHLAPPWQVIRWYKLFIPTNALFIKT